MELKPVEVWYWKIRGKGTLITDFLAALNVPFTLNSFQEMEVYGKFKMEVLKEYSSVNLPLIRDPNNGNKYVAETSAILQYIANQYKQDAGASSIEELPDFLILKGAIEDCFTGVLSRNLYGSKEKELLKEKVLATRARHAIKWGNFEKMLETNDWLFKNRFTYLDVMFATMIEILTTMETELDFKYFTESERKSFLAHMNRLTDIEGVKKWRNSDKFSKRPYAPPSMAAWG